jgi:hypothetical protein
MRTFLLTWNRAKTNLDAHSSRVRKLERSGYCQFNWSTNAYRKTSPGDRVFLLKQGESPCGIIASGYVIKGPYNGKFSDGKHGWFVEISWDGLQPLANDKILPRSQLNKGLLASVNWDSQGSGIEIPSEVAEELESRWEQLLNRPRALPPIADGQSSAWDGERVETTGYRRSRNRALRDEAYNRANGICESCEKDFSKVLDGKGVRVLQVHHKRQLGFTDSPRLTKASDLAVVCANCHMLIHVDPKKAMTLRQLKTVIGK